MSNGVPCNQEGGEGARQRVSIMYRIVYNRLEVDATIERSEIFDIPKCTMGAIVEARVQYVDKPVAVGTTLQKVVCNGKILFYTVISCCLEERDGTRVRFTNYETDEVRELEASIARLELENGVLTDVVRWEKYQMGLAKDDAQR